MHGKTEIKYHAKPTGKNVIYLVKRNWNKIGRLLKLPDDSDVKYRIIQFKSGGEWKNEKNNLE